MRRVVTAALLLLPAQAFAQAGGEHTESDWRVRTEVSKIDGATAIFATTTASETLNGVGSPVLTVRCHENRTGILFYAERALGQRWSVKVDWRFDDGPARSAFWSAASDFRGALIQGAPAIAWLKDAAHKRRVSIRANLYSGGSIEADFSLAGIEAPAARIEKLCKWGEAPPRQAMPPLPPAPPAAPKTIIVNKDLRGSVSPTTGWEPSDVRGTVKVRRGDGSNATVEYPLAPRK